MKAAILKSFGTPLSIETVPDPLLGTGEVLIDVVAAGVLAYAGEVFSGQRQYLLELPVIPGASGIGRVRAVGPDSTRLKVGEWVYLDPTVRCRDDAIAPDIILQGLTGGSPGALKLHKYFHDGTYAEQVRVPTENVIRLGDIDATDAPLWCSLSALLVPYGGFVAANFKPGEIALVNGATGAFGSSGVSVALGMGASVVIATGRNQAGLDSLSKRFGNRVRTVRMSGDEEKDRAHILEAAPGPIDCVLDILPPAASTEQVRTAALAVRPNGTVVLMGGVGMDGASGKVDLPYPWLMRNNITVRGQWMFPRESASRLVNLIKSGLIDLEGYETKCFPLDQVNEAVLHAAASAGPFRRTVVCP